MNRNLMQQMENDLMQVVHEYSILYCLSPRDLLPFITSMLIGQLTLCDFSDDHIRKTFDKIFESYKRKKANIEAKYD